jgi:hypothetical protein
MSRFARLGLVIVAGLLGCLVGESGREHWTQAQQNTAQKKKDQLNHYLQKLHSKFVAWDLDHNQVLDKKELAKAFRGPNAKPFDDLGDTAPVGPRARLLVTVPLPTPLIHFAAAEILTVLHLEDPPTPAVDYTKFPDYQFLVLVAKPGQTQVTRKDFDAWAKQYAQAIQQQQWAQAAVQAAQRQLQKAKQGLAQAQTRLQQAKTAAQRQQAQREVQRYTKEANQAQNSLQQHLQDLQQATAQLSAIPPAIRQALPLP